MDNQINSIGSVAAGVALVPLVAAKSQSVQEKPSPTKLAESQPSEAGVRPASASKKEVEAAVKEVSGLLAKVGSELSIQYDKANGRNVIKIVDSGTGGVVLQIPSEEVLAMARKLRQTANTQDTSGVLMDKEG